MFVFQRRNTRNAYVRFWQPFRESIERTLDDREQRSVPTVLVCIHSFTPTLNGVDRPWHLGLLFNRDDELATLLAHHLRVEAPDIVIGMNETLRGG